MDSCGQTGVLDHLLKEMNQALVYEGKLSLVTPVIHWADPCVKR